MKFKELAVWQTFIFDHSTLTSCANLAHGPWVKVSARCYRKDTNPFSSDNSERAEHSLGVNRLNQVGSINTEVKVV